MVLNFGGLNSGLFGHTENRKDGVSNRDSYEKYVGMDVISAGGLTVTENKEENLWSIGVDLGGQNTGSSIITSTTNTSFVQMQGTNFQHTSTTGKILIGFTATVTAAGAETIETDLTKDGVNQGGILLRRVKILNANDEATIAMTRVFLIGIGTSAIDWEMEFRSLGGTQVSVKERNFFIIDI